MRVSESRRIGKVKIDSTTNDFERVDFDCSAEE